MHEIDVIQLPGLTQYGQALELQHARRDLVETGGAPDTLYIVQHAPVITLGRKASETNILLSRDELAARGIDVCPTDRGGDVTYHGPGQLVAYPVLNLNHWQCNIQWYLRGLEQVLINMLARYGLRGERVDGLTGVWVDGAKIAAIGIGIHRWTTFHGIALNINPDPAHFACIIPCGIADKPVATLAQLMEAPPAYDQVSQDFITEFLSFFS